jgi:hypothetical protein
MADENEALKVKNADLEMRCKMLERVIVEIKGVREAELITNKSEKVGVKYS